MKIVTTHTFDKLFRKLDVKIQGKAAQKMELFKENPFNPIDWSPTVLVDRDRGD